MQRWTGALALMGIPTLVEADDPALLHAALAPYAAWPESAADGASPPLRLHLTLSPELPGTGDDDRPITVRVDGRRLSISGAGVHGEADADRREARCAIPRALAEDPHRLAAEVLDTLLLFLATRSGRVPVHASGVVIGETAAVLAGSSGSGKSTLALAALRAGLPVLSDDTVYVQTAPALRVWGFPRPIHVYPHDAPDADRDGAMRLRSGRWKRAVPVSSDRPPVAGRAALFLLERGDRVALHAIDPGQAVERMAALLEPGFDHFSGDVPGVVRALAAGGAWRLTLSANPAEAVRLLCDTLRP